MSAIRLVVVGEPIPQGSVRAFGNRVVQGGSPEGRRKLGDWRIAIAEAARDQALPGLIDEAVIVTADFYLTKPKSIPKWRQWAWKKPDVDKLVRAVLDSLQGTILADDSRVVDLHVRKAYATESRPGVVVTVELAAEDRYPWESAIRLNQHDGATT